MRVLEAAAALGRHGATLLEVRRSSGIDPGGSERTGAQQHAAEEVRYLRGRLPTSVGCGCAGGGRGGTAVSCGCWGRSEGVAGGLGKV